ncbi:ESX secretion-associated protein EspG [Lentzea sp. NPDC004782]|uniref:ESX secretion-associated protein EspG n=1 Tax=Lentzea sp. NPDC004782 TaxID=3154458 RepID=UPI0033A3EADE
MLHSGVVLPVTAVYVAWQAEALPELHRALLVDLDIDGDAIAEGDVDGALATLRDSWSVLEQHGLARGRQVHPGLGRTLRLIAEAGRDYYAFFNSGDENTRSALVAVSGGEAVRVITLPDKHFVIEPVRADEAPQALIAALPEAPPGRGRVISLPADALMPKAVGYQDTGSVLQKNRPASSPQEQQVQDLRRLLAEPRLGGGQLFAGHRDRTGKRVRVPKPVTFFDTPGGRYLQYEVNSGSGPWMTVQPGDFTTMASRLGALATT